MPANLLEDLAKSLGVNPDLALLSGEIDAYLDRMVKLIAIAEFAERHDNQRQVTELVYVLEQLTAKMNAKVVQYQQKHGEL